jgi:hypothetical protein
VLADSVARNIDPANADIIHSAAVLLRPHASGLQFCGWFLASSTVVLQIFPQLSH